MLTRIEHFTWFYVLGGHTLDIDIAPNKYSFLLGPK